MTYRDFDSERAERWQSGLVSFSIGGDRYVVRPTVDVMALAKWDELDAEGISNMEAMQVIDDVMVAFILPQQAQRYRDARARRLEDLLDDDPSDEDVINASKRIIDLAALMEVVPWLIEEATGRPFTQPDDSTGSPSTNGTASTGDSPSVESTRPASTSDVS